MKIIVTLRQYASYAIFATIAGGLLNSANAQVQFPVEKPVPKVGDVWKYQRIDLWTGRVDETFENELVAVEADQFVIRNKNSAASQPETIRMTADLSPCRNMMNSEQMVCVGPYRFPMQRGQKTEYEKQPYSLNGEGHSAANCLAMAEEKVTVPAGTFDTVRVECKGFWTRLFNGRFTGSFAYTDWYAPKVNAYVKRQYSDNLNGSPYNKRQFELVEFIPGKN